MINTVEPVNFAKCNAGNNNNNNNSNNNINNNNHNSNISRNVGGCSKTILNNNNIIAIYSNNKNNTTNTSNRAVPQPSQRNLTNVGPIESPFSSKMLSLPLSPASSAATTTAAAAKQSLNSQERGTPIAMSFYGVAEQQHQDKPLQLETPPAPPPSPRRVEVQQLQRYSVLRNNCWQPGLTQEEMARVEQHKICVNNNNNNNCSSRNNNNNIQSKIAFCRVEVNPRIWQAARESRRAAAAGPSEDRENAFRAFDVQTTHNYAKTHYDCHEWNKPLDDEDDDEDEDEDEVEEDEEEVVEGDKHDYEGVQNCVNVEDACYGFVKRRQRIREMQDDSACVQSTRYLPYGRAAQKTDLPMNQVGIPALSPAAQQRHTIIPRGSREAGHCAGTGVTPAESEECAAEESAPIENVPPPDHHARRPMNAFLIFCKRHRAIVKERYKTLENRAITKILGDWWASLDVSEKKFYTNLAKQNKDAFFTAHPNFKWYKLPAPPLRTHTTRPTNAEQSTAPVDVGPEADESKQTQLPEDPGEIAPLCGRRSDDNFFKLADVAHMGELTTLLTNRPADCHAGADEAMPVAAVVGDAPQNALQQALSETTQFLNTHIPSSATGNPVGATTVAEQVEVDFAAIPPSADQKVGLYSEPPHTSSNSSADAEEGEDDGGPVPRKRSRSCKGKIYQELINSGQITAVAKKPKTAAAATTTNNNMPLSPSAEQHSGRSTAAAAPVNIAVGVKRRIVSESSSSTSYSPSSSSLLLSSPGSSLSSPPPPPHRSLHGASSPPPPPPPTAASAGEVEASLGQFDLEERIKHLPALSLDAYLQRKRNTKKKKKLSTRKRNHSCSKTGNINEPLPPPPQAATPTPNTSVSRPLAVAQRPQPPPAAVGSQKRKARKESITRRDVSAIENEVAAIIAVNGAELEISLDVDMGVGIAAGDGVGAADERFINGCTSIGSAVINGRYFYRSNGGERCAVVAISPNRVASGHQEVDDSKATEAPTGGRSFNADATTSTTSDLLFLAEVAANRTELA